MMKKNRFQEIKETFITFLSVDRTWNKICKNSLNKMYFFCVSC